MAKKIETFPITRDQFISLIKKRITQKQEKLVKLRPGTHAFIGANSSLLSAQDLLAILEEGGMPTNARITAYFGKGARLSD